MNLKDPLRSSLCEEVLVGNVQECILSQYQDYFYDRAGGWEARDIFLPKLDLSRKYGPISRSWFTGADTSNPD